MITEAFRTRLHAVQLYWECSSQRITGPIWQDARGRCCLNYPRLWADIWRVIQTKDFFLSFFFFKERCLVCMMICLSEIVLKISIWREDVGSVLGLTLPFWSMPWRRSVTRRMIEIHCSLEAKYEMTHGQPTSVVTNVWVCLTSLLAFFLLLIKRGCM